MKVIKRDGSVVDYDRSKIAIAIGKANAEVPQEDRLSQEGIDAIIDRIEGLKRPRMLVEDIQDLVEQGLVAENKFHLAKTYIIYRYNRALVRKANTTDESILSLLRNENKELAEENSNKNTMIAATQRDYIAGEVSRDLTRRILLPEYISKAHDEGAIHFHDADYFIQPIFNCCLINIGDMLDNGTVMNGKLIESPKSFQVACTVMTQIIACVASNQYGGQSVDLRHLGKYLRRSREKFRKHMSYECAGQVDEATLERLVNDRLKDELKSGVQTIQYQINTLMTTNGQSPFVTLFLNLQEDDPYLEENAMIVEEVLRQRLEGIKNEKGVYITPAFPKLVYVLDEHNCLKGGKYDYITELAVKCSAKRMYPDYISAKKMRENYEGNVFSPMGCRSFLAPWKDENGNYKFEGRFNQGVVSLNLPQIGILAQGGRGTSSGSCWDERLQLCFEALMCRHKRPEERALRLLPHPLAVRGHRPPAQGGPHRAPAVRRILLPISLGYIGLYEVTKLMRGCSHTESGGREFAMQVMNRLRAACDGWKKETNIGFALYGTPAESLCYRFAPHRQGALRQPSPTSPTRATTPTATTWTCGSTSTPSTSSPLRASSKRSPPAGASPMWRSPNMRHNLEALKEVVRFIYDNIQYAEFNTKSDYCQCCGYDGEIMINDDFQWECPVCHNKDQNKMNVTPPHLWIPG